MRIGELAWATDTTPRALRHYEQAGLLSSERAANGYRVYDRVSVVRVRNIRLALAAGFTVDDIRLFQTCLDRDLVATSVPDADVATGSGRDPLGATTPVPPTLDELRPTPECVGQSLRVARGRLAVLDQRIAAQLRARERLAATVRRIADPAPHELG